MEQSQPHSQHRLTYFLYFLLTVNILALDILVAKNLLTKRQEYVSQAKAVSISIAPSPAARESTLSEPTPTQPLPIAKNVQQTVSQQKENTVKEFFVPLGTGSITATDWTDVPGVKAEVNSNSYGSIKQVFFEASMHVPNANQIVEVRLYNETDKYVVDNSIFLYPSGTTENFRIASIQLGSGSKTYKVQMKTQLGHTAILDQARIHITTN